MTARSFATSQITAVLFAMLMASAARAQGPLAGEFDGLYDGHDLQFFRPADLDFDGRPYRRDAGFFFRYDKLSWSFTGERTRVGLDGFSNASTNPYRVFDDGGVVVPVDPTDPDGDSVFIPGTEVKLAAPQLANGLNSTAPNSAFAWGDRYEFGHFQDDDGWMIGILDGPEVVTNEIYGYGFSPLDETTTGGDSLGLGPGLPSRFPGGPDQLINPLGSVLIVFNVPLITDINGNPVLDDSGNQLTLMHGYLDLVEGVGEGPAGAPGGAAQGDRLTDGVADGDGIPDDIDRDGQFGNAGIEDGDPGEVPGALGGGLPHDLGDLVLLPTSFQSVQVRNFTETQGIEIMKTYRLPNKYRMAKHQNNNLMIAYGARYLRLNDNFIVNGEGGTLGTSSWDTLIENHIVGPQIALSYQHQRGKFHWDWNGRFLFGYNIQNWAQTAALGEDHVTGQVNAPLYFPPTYSTHGRQDNDFSPVAEMRVQLSYQLTNALALKLGYNALLVDNVRRAAQQVDYSLPSMGFIDGGTSEIFANGVSFGFEAVY
ncbi:MAG: BBP7 family outer membrane beta-barrel protein [Planctomycetota bacterium]